MSRRTGLIFHASSILCFFGYMAYGQNDSGQPIKIKGEDLAGRVQIMGKLDRPLGSIVIVTAKLSDKELGYKRSNWEVVLEIDEVEGKKLAETVICAASLQIEKLVPGKRYKLIGFETGGFRNYPKEVYTSNILHALGKAPPAPGGPFGFYIHFAVLKRLEDPN